MATYYVATAAGGGSNSNSGTISSPFLTVAHGVGVLSPGDTLYIRAGTYTERLAYLPSGTSWGSPVTIAAYPAETVTIASNVAGWPIMYLAGESYLIFDRLIFDGINLQTGRFGIELDPSSHHIRIQNSEVKRAPKTGILVVNGTSYNEFLNLSVHDNGSIDSDHGFYIESNNNLVENCDVYQNAGWGIHIYADLLSNTANNNIVRNNKSHNNARVGPRGNGIILSSGNGNQAYNNIVWGNVIGIQIAYGTPTDTLVYNNTVYNNIDYGIRIQYYGVDGTTPQPPTNSIIKNNIVYQNGTNYSNLGTGTIQDHNLLDGTDPLFVDAVNANFHLQSGSPAIDAGTTIGAVTTDFDGITRPQGSAYDIGAYEVASAGNSNLALNRTATASSIESSSYLASAAFDGNITTRWASAFSDPQWIYVDLGANYMVNGVKLIWEAAYAVAFKIQASTDAVTWTDIYSTTTGTGGTQMLAVTLTSARYVRMYGTVRATVWGYSLWEMEVYGPATPVGVSSMLVGGSVSPSRSVGLIGF